MPGDSALSLDDSVLATLLGPPFHLSFDAAKLAMLDGSAKNLIERHEQNMRERRESELSQLKELREIQRARVREQSNKVQAAWNREHVERHNAAKAGPKPGDHIGAAANAGQLIAADAMVSEGGREPVELDGLVSDVATLAGAPREMDFEPPKNPPTETAKNSEPERDRYFVCKTCHAGFVGRRRSPAVSCVCGEAVFGDDGVQPFSQMGIPTCSGAAFEVTELVDCGKLSVARPNPDLSFAFFTMHVRPRRNVPQRQPVTPAPANADEFTADVRASVAGHAVARQIQPATDYMVRAAMAGSEVAFSVHYHTRICGVDTNAAGEKFAKREPTGDMRICGSVIARARENEADGSLLFTPVVGCARCGEDHVAKIAFWKLKNPVHEWRDGTPGRVIASHFGYCPTTAEPIMLISSEPEIDLAAKFDEPAAVKTEVEQAVNDIGGLIPIDGPAAPGILPARQSSESSDYEAGRAAAKAGGRHTDNPHDVHSMGHDEWRRGFVAGKGENG